MFRKICNNKTDRCWDGTDMGGYAESVHRQLDHGESSEEQYHLVVYLHDEHGYR